MPLCRYAACVIWILPKLSLEFLLTRLWLFFHVFPSRRETLASCAVKCMPGFLKPSQSWDSDISDRIIRWCLMIQVGKKLRIRFDLCISVVNTNDTTWWEHNTSCLLSQYPFWLQTSGHRVNPLDASVESISCWLRVPSELFLMLNTRQLSSCKCVFRLTVTFPISAQQIYPRRCP